MNNYHSIQASITSVGFPETLEAFENMLDKNEYIGNHLIDMDVLLQFQPSNNLSWTAPKWMTEGDILFFYHTKRAKATITRLYKQAIQKYGSQYWLTNVLQHAGEIASLYAGSIFGYADIAGAIEYERSSQFHFDSRFFAPLGQFYLFQYPLPAVDFAEYVKIGQNTTIPLHGSQFDDIRALLESHNSLPETLQQAKFGEDSFHTINKTNWLKIACNPSTRFLHEAQLREYFLNYLLDAIKDQGTARLEECQCYRNGNRTGIADYFIRVHGFWIPVEAKLNLQTERGIVAQVAKYTHVDAFLPTKGINRAKRFETEEAGLCMIVDQSGVYVVDDGRFVGAERSKPIWHRKDLTAESIGDIRRWLHDRS